ncbi:MAG: hypothetical protein ONB17_10360 [candidate division KSB1 bacterium]|nr:hypothetical protein [candidate division KSB1 bacterium]MDZ7295000.1 hypothetical protein [candidate division KSB1 bacterium]MDZ7379098.1 hypothetical protein [candidate division KSB1 bacterium]MDZ7393937.1 hypothetical protein [candidate division KSB1 bacterium]MDZ7412990.1 hypothetical protein [candidate division KSB1 bacterium]
MSWIVVWKLVTVLTLISFAVLAAIVLVGGSRNIAQMLKDLRRSSETN